MRQIAILSNQDDLAKTFIAISLARLALPAPADVVLVDADLDSSTLTLWLAPETIEQYAWENGKTARISADLCRACGRCAQVCQFDAVRERKPIYVIDELACVGCASCVHQCPVEAITMLQTEAGHWCQSETPLGRLFHGELLPGMCNSGRLVTCIRQQASLYALERQSPYLIIDGPSGLASPTIAACAGVDLAVIVTAPTQATITNLERSIATMQCFGIPTAVIVTSSDINEEQCARLNQKSTALGAPILGEIPYTSELRQAVVSGQVETTIAMGEHLTLIWQNIHDHIE